MTNAAPSRVLLTGAAGFIGSHLTRQLIADGHAVTAILRPGEDCRRIADVLPAITTIEGDLGDVSALLARLQERQPEICIHLAWQGWKGSAQDNVASLSASLRLLHAMPALGCRRFVSAGTCYEYDLSDGRLSETSPLKPREVYGACKKALYEVGQAFGDETGVSVAVSRIFYTYGPHEPASGLVPYIIQSLLRGEPAKLTPGDQVRDYVHAEDIASAIWAVARSEARGAVNIASGVPVTVAEIARKVGALLGRPDLVHLGALPYRSGEPPTVLGDTTRLRDVGWLPRYDMDRGLAHAVEWWRRQTHVTSSNP